MPSGGKGSPPSSTNPALRSSLKTLTLKTLTVEPATILEPSNPKLGSRLEKLIANGATADHPSSVANAAVGSEKFAGSADGKFKVRSVVPPKSKSFGKGMSPAPKSKFADILAGFGSEPSSRVSFTPSTEHPSIAKVKPAPAASESKKLGFFMEISCYFSISILQKWLLN